MSDLIKALMDVEVSPEHEFIVRPELIQGYNEEEIKEIEQRYSLSIHGQFKEFLMVMGKCSGGLLTGKNLFIYNKNFEPKGIYFGLENQEFWQNDIDIPIFKQKLNGINLIDRQFFELAENDGEVRNKVYFLLTNNLDNLVYCWDFSDDNEVVYVYGELFDFLCDWRKNEIILFKGNENHQLFRSLTTGRLL